MTTNKDHTKPDRVDQAFKLLFLILSPVTLLGLGGFILGVFGIFEFDLPVYSPLVGLAIGVFLGFVAKLLLYIDL